MRTAAIAVVTVLLWSACATIGHAQDRPRPEEAGVEQPAEASAAEQAIRDWAATPKLVARQMIDKYGQPDGVTKRQLVWYDNGPWKRTLVNREEIPHDFPMPHTDLLEQVIDREVPPDKVDDLARFDGSVTVERTAGEMSARCDTEAANFLALNLANDIIEGNKSVEEARRAYARDAVAFFSGKEPASMARLQFKPAPGKAQQTDRAIISGAPVRPQTADGELQPVRGVEREGDATVLAAMFAINAHEVKAGRLALDKSDNQRIQQLAKRLREEHGSAVQQTLSLAQQLETRPVLTESLQTLSGEMTGHLAELAKLEGAAFDRQFLDTMAQEHTKALNLIDNELLPQAENPQIRKALQAQRKHVDSHLDRVRTLQGATR